MKLHLGCGAIFLSGFMNIDTREGIGADFVCDARSIPYPPNSIERIETYHMIEHIFPQSSHRMMFNHWYNLLKPDGVLIIECPDFDAAVKEYLAGNTIRLNNIFGLHRWPGDTHVWGYNYERLASELVLVGFQGIVEKEAQDGHTKIEPCIRVEAYK